MNSRSLSRAIKLTGTDEPSNKARLLKVGNITALFDQGNLRNICFCSIEVVRGIAYLARNVGWGTFAPELNGLRVTQTASSFKVTYAAVCKNETQELHYQVAIEASADGRLRFQATAHPQTDFITNRTGFVVLHPLEGVSGKTVSVLHTDGTKEKSKFPKLISPGQPIFWIRSLRHDVMPGVTAEVTMEGDAFEMEDHRNWMDASYKTYVHSLLDPWPYTLEKGKAYEQSVTLEILGKPKSPSRTTAKKAITVEIADPSGRMPAVSTAVSMGQALPALAVANYLKTAQLSNLVCQLDGRSDKLLETAKAFASLSKATQTPIKLEFILPAKASASEEMGEFAEVLKRVELNPASVIVTHAHDLRSFQPNQDRPWGPSYEDMAAAARNCFPDVPVGGGMLSYFTELNRKPVPKGIFDFITHSVCPIVHAADDLSVMETLEALPWIFASTRAMVGRTPYHLGPSSLSARDNPYGPALAPNPDGKRVCLTGNDPREKGVFAAAWTLGLVAAAARNTIADVAISAATGGNGLINPDGTVTPAYHVAAGLASANGARYLSTSSSAPSKVVALAHIWHKKKVLWLANLLPDAQTVAVKGLTGRLESHEISDKTFSRISKDVNYLAKAGRPMGSTKDITLPAYAVLRISGT